MTDRPDSLDEELFAYLEQIDDQLRELCETGLAIDPDDLERELSIHAAFTKSSVEALLDEIENAPERYANLKELVDLATREFLVASSLPVVLRTTADDSNPELKHSPAMLMSMINRALKLCAEHAGAGGVINMHASSNGSRAVLSFETQADTEPSTLPVDLRSRSLADLMLSLGGELTVDEAERELALTMVFGVGAPSV